VRVFNLAYSAHNSRDSMLKYRWLADQRFDLVIVYDGINDTRMNNAPPEIFRDDYSHCHWYRCVNRLDEHPVICQAALPFTLLFVAERCAEGAGLVQYMPRHEPAPAWTKHGKDVRTRATLQRNLGEIIATARQKRARMVMMTFSYHIPANYSREAFVAGKLDYSNPNLCPVELSGEPAHVIEALRQQNNAVRELAAQNPDVVFVDQEHLLVRGRINFDDCCHLTPAGCTQFAANILAALDATR
jgi:transposase